MSKLGYNRNVPVYFEQNEMSELGYNRNMCVYVEQNEMSELGNNRSMPIYMLKEWDVKAGLQQKYAHVCWTEWDVKAGLQQKHFTFVLNRTRCQTWVKTKTLTLPVCVEQNEMSKLGYNKERDEELQGQHKQLQRDIRSIQDKLDTLEAK